LKYDILQVDDKADELLLMSRAARKCNFTYKGVESLTELEAALRDTSARFYVVDIMFPINPGGIPENLAQEAVTLIRQYAHQPSICLYSGNDGISAIANDLQVKHVSKRNTCWDLVSYMENQNFPLCPATDL
jgi:hypothetical protein